MRLALAIGLAAYLCSAGEPATEGVGLTIYSTPAQPGQQYWNPNTQRWEQPDIGFAIVKERRKIRFAAGTQSLRFTDVAARIDATTVHFVSLTDPAGTTVLEQNFEYDLVSADKILEKFIDKNITLELEGNRLLAGTLLSAQGGQLVLRTEDAASPIQILARGGLKNIRFPDLPGGLITKPTLVWMVDAAKAGEQLARVTYQTGGMGWNADYTAVISPDDAALDIAGWVTISNLSGASFRDAQLKLVAGDVHRAEPPGVPMERASLAKGAGNRDEAGFAEKSFFEYHLYTLGRSTTLPDRSIKQLELFHPVTGVPARKIFLYYGGVGMNPYGGQPYMDRNYGLTSNTKVDIYLEFQNGKAQGMGMPLPAGKVRVYKKDEADGSLELIGEDNLDHTPKDEKVRLQLGSAFDVVAERRQTDFRMDERAHWMRESFEIKLRNHKTEDIEVIVKENLYRWANWTIEKKSHDFEKQDARTVHFPVKVAKDGETVLTYTVLYTW